MRFENFFYCVRLESCGVCRNPARVSRRGGMVHGCVECAGAEPPQAGHAGVHTEQGSSPKLQRPGGKRNRICRF